jgi:hypothetical protein
MSFIMKRITVLLLICCCACAMLRAQRLIPVGRGYSATSVNAAIFRANAVASLGRTQYVAYYDSTGTVTLAQRNLNRRHSSRQKDSSPFQVHRTQYVGNVRDGHNVISIAVDGAGYLHVAFDHHGSPLHYARSVAPGSLELGPLEPMIGRGEECVTYPEFYRLSNGDLLFLYRTGASGNGDLVLNRYDVRSRRWTRVQDNLIDGEGKRNGYWQACVDQRDGVHLSWVWRETWKVETNHDLCYAYSPDAGRTWQRSDGTPQVVPMTQDNAEYIAHIPQRSELINQTAMTIDREGRPYIATYWRAAGDSIPQYRLVYRTADGAWQQTQIGQRRTPFSLSGGGTKRIPIARPKVVVRTHRRRTEVMLIFRDAERGDRVSLAHVSDLEAATVQASDPKARKVKAETAWTVTDLTDFPVGAWEPSFDTDLWREHNRLHLYVQTVGQGDGERLTNTLPQVVYILEAE